MRVRKKEDSSSNCEREQRQQLRHGEYVAHSCARLHAAIIHECEKSDQDCEHGQPGEWFFHTWPELREIVCEKVSSSGRCRYPHQPHQPAHFNADKPAEGYARVQIRAARFAESRSNLGKAGHDDCNDCSREKISERTQTTYVARCQRREAENSASNDGIDNQRRERPSPNRPNQSG